MFVGHTQLGCQGLREAFGVVSGVVGGGALIGEQLRVGPHPLLVGAPINVQRPAGQLLAGVPLALAKVKEATLPIFVAQFEDEVGRKAALRRPQGVRVPFGGVPVVHCHKGRLAAHRQAHVARGQLPVHRSAEFHHVGPLLGRVGLGHTRRLKNSGDTHMVVELNFALVHAAFNRCRTRGLRRAGQRDVAFAGEQARRGVQPDPACAGQINLAPGVQVGEVNFGAAGAVQRLHV